MQGDKEYCRITRDYLKNYMRFKAMIENLTSDIESIDCALQEYHIGTVHYGESVRGRYSDLNQTEREAAKHEALEQQKQEKESEKGRLELLVRKIDRSLGCLSKEQRDLLTKHYFERKSWRAIGMEMYLTEEWACEKGRRALKDVAFTMFGDKALTPKEREQMLFI